VSKDPAGKTARFIYISDGVKESAWRVPSGVVPMRVGWRLVAADNRSLGRSWVVYPIFDECVDAATRLRDRIGEVTSSALFDRRQANWSWTVLLDDAPVAICVHAYRRRVECLRALDQFVAAVRTTTEMVEELRYYGPNALRVYNRPDPDPSGGVVSLAATTTVPAPIEAARPACPAT